MSFELRKIIIFGIWWGVGVYWILCSADVADIWLDTSPIGADGRFLTGASLYARSMTKYKLLKDFLFPRLTYSLMIDRSGRSIDVRTTLILFRKPANSWTILNVVSSSVAVQANQGFRPNNDRTFHSCVYELRNEPPQLATRCTSSITTKPTCTRKVGLVRILWNFLWTNSSSDIKI